MPARPPRILITAGPTHEPLDAVRYVANRSSGRMGEALADASSELGASVTLLLGPVPREPGPRWSASARFRTTADLEGLLREEFPRHDCLIMAAAVADFRPARFQPGKIPRAGEIIQMQLEPTPDLLARVAASRSPRQYIVGFALESRAELAARAAEKLRCKGVDALVANPLESMESDRVEGRLHLADGRVLEPPVPGPLPKEAFARWLMATLWPLIPPPAEA